MRVAAFILALLGASPAFAQDVPGEWDSPVVMACPLLNNMTCEGRTAALARNSSANHVDDAGVLQSVLSNVARQSPTKGLLVEEGRTNRLTYSRDFSNVAWTKTNLTAALTQTGLDGVANSASLLTATAANGTAIQSIAGLASTARINTAYLKRGVGSGAVELTSDNGGTWTPVTLTAAFQRFEIARTANTGIDFGIRIITSGDTVIADFAQAEEGIFASEAIATATTATARLGDLATVSTVGWPVREGRIEFTYTPKWSSGTALASTYYLFDSRTATDGILLYTSNTTVGPLSFQTKNASGTTTTTGGNLTWTAGTVYRIEMEWRGGNKWVYRTAGGTRTLVASDVTGTAYMPGAHAATASLGSALSGLPSNAWVRAVEVRQ